MDRIPRIGLGIIIENSAGEILIGKRKGSHAPYYSIPGGLLEIGESLEAGATREITEEHGITILEPTVIAIANDLKTFWEEGFHGVSAILVARSFIGEPTIREPNKCEEILWADPHQLPEPHFMASRLAVACYVSGQFYVGMSE